MTIKVDGTLSVLKGFLPKQSKKIYVYGGKRSGKKTFVEALKEYERVIFHSINHSSGKDSCFFSYTLSKDLSNLSETIAEKEPFLLHYSEIILCDTLDSFVLKISQELSSLPSTQIGTYEKNNSIFIYLYDICNASTLDDFIKILNDPLLQNMYDRKSIKNKLLSCK